ncbi:MAG: 16S rRNA (uracil(1498)-N(3))-methyltransferase [Clostridiales bacterium]|nr:16S rRNA (uracil(1498)-N(3))-methyltransferase [Clostridiales bacterium]MCF8021453.1 16S rRNA (uracil(1498)-N(3))-methyltransferase [Clostridiales bacterium]
MARFFISPEQVNSGRINISGPDVRHITKVLRMGPGDIITALDGDGKVYEARIESTTKDKVKCEILAEGQAGGEPPVRVTLVQGLSKGEKMDLVVQKATELGVTSIIPAECKYSVTKLTAKKAADRRDRWQRIAVEASKQCRRSVVPRVVTPMKWAEALEDIPGEAVPLMPYEGETEQDLKGIVQKIKRPLEIFVFIGPEGGIHPEEFEQAHRKGVIPLTLGPRILRTETAGLAALFMVLYEWGDLGGVSNGKKENGNHHIGVQG